MTEITDVLRAELERLTGALQPRGVEDRFGIGVPSPGAFLKRLEAEDR